MKKIFMIAALFFCLLPDRASAEEELIRVGFDPHLPPFSFLDEGGNPTGYAVDLLDQIAKMQDWRIEFVQMEMDELIAQAEQGHIDIILGLKYRGSHDQILDFSESIFTMSEVVIVPKNDQDIYHLTDLKGKVVAVQRATDALDMLDHVRHVHVNVASSQPQAMDMLLLGRADAFIGNPWTATYILRQSGREDQYDIRITSIQPAEYSFAVRDGELERLSQINEGLNRLKQSKEFKHLYSKWFDPYSSETLWWQRLTWLLVGFASIAIAFVSIVYFWNQRLKAAVEKKTWELTHHLGFQKQVLESVDNGILSLDHEGRIMLFNRRAIEILGLSPNPVGHPVHAYASLHEITDALKGISPNRGEIILDSGQERQKVVHYYVDALQTGERTGWIVTLQDLTRQKQLQEKLVIQEKLRALGQLVAGIAHELRNPLTSMKMFVDLIPSKLENPRFREELLKHVPAEMKRLNNLVEDLLDYTRRKEPLKEWMEWKELLSSVVKSFQIRFPEIEISIRVEPGMKVYGDRQRIKQVLVNLIINAADAVAARDRKEIEITAYEDASFCCLQVTDSGKGMSEAELQSLFQPFYTTKAKGVGLGLYICYNIMQEHGGDILVSSVKGKGTSFILKFPNKGVEHEYHSSH